MKTETQPNYDQLIVKLEATISKPRLRRYLIKAGHRSDRALNLYLWNARIGEAFHVPIQASEVALRNRINSAIISSFDANWWDNSDFLSEIDYERQKDLETTFRRIKKLGLEKCTDQVVAGLSFGFWVGMLGSRFNPKIWSGGFRGAFPHAPADVDRELLFQRARFIADLRNRISHHEPIFERNLSLDYSDLMEFLRWISPDKSLWISPSCRVQEILRQKP